MSLFLLTPSLAYELDSPATIYGILVFFVLFIVSANALIPVFDKSAVFIGFVLAALIAYIIFFYGVDMDISAISTLGSIPNVIPADAKALAAFLCLFYGIYNVFSRKPSYMKILVAGLFGVPLLYPEVDYFTSAIIYSAIVFVFIIVKTKKS